MDTEAEGIDEPVRSVLLEGVFEGYELLLVCLLADTGARPMPEDVAEGG